MIENLAMQYLTGQLVVSYRTINRFRVAEGMEELIRDLFIDLNLRLKMEELVTLDCLFIDGTKIEANANKYSFVWKKATEKFFAKLQEQIQVYFQEEITPLIHQAIELDTQEPISSEQLLAFAQVLEEELEKLNQDIEETPVKGKDERKTQRRKLKKVMNRNNIIFLILVIISQVFQKKKWLDLSLYFENIMIKKEKGLILLNIYFIILNIC